jgi:CHAT domain-containing protein
MKMKKIYLLSLFILGIFFSVYSQQLNQYTDSILVNINKNNKLKAKFFIELAEASIKNNDIKKDTIFADYLYAKGVYHYFQPTDSIECFLEASKIWSKSKPKNYFKIMNLYYFLGEIYWAKNDDSSALYYFLKSYSLIEKYQFYKIITIKEATNYFRSQTIYSLAFIHHKRKLYRKAKKYSNEYIQINEPNAIKEFNFEVADAYRFRKDILGQEIILKKILNYYFENKIENPKLLFKINYELFFLYASNGKKTEEIKYGEKALDVQEKYNLEVNKDVHLIYTCLISDYSLIEDKINSSKYKILKDLSFPDEQVKNEYEILNGLIKTNEFEIFKIKFDEFEKEFTSKKDYNKLSEIYQLSIIVFLKNVIFKKEDINRQIEIIENNKFSLSENSSEFFELFQVFYYTETDDYLKAIEICNNNLNAKSVNIKLQFYKYKTYCEENINSGNSKNTAYKTLEIATSIYGKNDFRLLPYQILVLKTHINEVYRSSSEVALKTFEILKENKLENSEIAINYWYVLGQIDNTNENFRDAEVYLKKSIDIAEKQKYKTKDENILYGLILLSDIKRNTSKSEALLYLEKAKEIIDKDPTISLKSIGEYYFILGQYYFSNFDFNNAKNALEKSFTIKNGNAAKVRKSVLIEVNYFLEKNDDKTIKEIEEYRSINKGTLRLTDLYYCLNYNSGDLIGTKKKLVDQLEKIIKENNTYFHLLSDKERENTYKGFADQFEYLNTFLLYPDEAFLKDFINLRFYYKSLLLAYSIKSNIVFDIDKELYLEFKENSSKINTSIENKNDTIAEITALKLRNREIEKILSLNNTSLEVPTLKDLSKKLKPNEAYVEIIRINKQVAPAKNKGVKIVEQFTDSIYYGAIIIKKNTLPKFVLIDEICLIESTYYPYFKSQIQNKNKEEINKKSYYYLFEKIDEELNGIKKIYLVTDGVYNSINIESIYNPAKKKYVLDYLKVKLIQSIRSITESNQEVKVKDNLKAALFGNPKFELRNKIMNDSDLFAKRDIDFALLNKIKPVKKLSYLVASQKEIHSIGTILNEANWEVKTYTNDVATEENLKNLNTIDVLHIATHGFFIDDKNNSKQSINPASILKLNNIDNSFLKSGLFLAGAQNTLNGESSGNNNGILTAEEAKNLNLDNTELVVLSACETGLGDNLVGEGVVGLQRAFMIAGAKSVIMSLWKVDDASTQKLMTSFYSNWVKKKMSKNDAFNAAKIEIKKAHPQPYYWASFVLLE